MSGTAKDGKKGKKGKKTMPLAEFLGTNAVPDGFDKKMINWADVTEDDEMSDIPLPKFKEELILPTAPKASRPNEIDTSRVPTMPPYKAYIGNIPYGAGEEELKQFFENLHPISVQLPRDDKGTGRTRGFGYVEFETRDCLIEALKMHGSTLNDRVLKVSLPEEGQRDMERRGDRGSGMTGPGDEDRTAGDWRKAPRPEQQNATSHQPQYQQQQQQYSSAPRPDMSREMAGPWRSAAASVASDSSRGQRNGYDNPPPARNYEPAGGAFRESRSGFDSYADDRRPPGGAFSDRRTGGYDNYSRGHGSDDRRRDGGYDNSYRDNYRDAPRQSSRYDDYNRRPAYDRYESDRGSDFERPQRNTGGYERPAARPADPARAEDYRAEPAAPAVDEAPKTRPKLQLQPRSKPLDEIAAPAPVASRNIFGDAKPVDTARKEQEVEEKLKSLDVKEPIVEPGRTRTISSGSGSGSTSNRMRKESESDRRDENRPRRNDNYSRESDFGRRNDRPAPDRGFDNRDRRPGFGNDQRRPLQDDRRRNDRPYQDRPVLNRRDDRRDDRGPIRGPRPDDDRRPERRPELNRERDNNNGVKYDATKKEKDVDYTVKNKFGALNDDDFDASSQYPVHD